MTPKQFRNLAASVQIGTGPDGAPLTTLPALTDALRRAAGQVPQQCSRCGETGFNVYSTQHWPTPPVGLPLLCDGCRKTVVIEGMRRESERLRTKGPTP